MVNIQDETDGEYLSVNQFSRPPHILARTYFPFPEHCTKIIIVFLLIMYIIINYLEFDFF